MVAIHGPGWKAQLAPRPLQKPVAKTAVAAVGRSAPRHRTRLERVDVERAESRIVRVRGFIPGAEGCGARSLAPQRRASGAEAASLRPPPAAPQQRHSGVGSPPARRRLNRPVDVPRWADGAAADSPLNPWHHWGASGGSTRRVFYRTLVKGGRARPAPGPALGSFGMYRRSQLGFRRELALPARLFMAKLIGGSRAGLAEPDHTGS